MTPNFQSSFIPKEPVATQEVFKKKKTGLVGVLVVSLFISSIIISAGLYFYKGMIKSDIQNLELQLAESEKNIDRKTIEQMVSFDKKLSAVKMVVLKHRVVSNFIGLLASSTVSSVHFSSFNYGDLEKGSLAVKLKGKASSYASVALQESIFSQNKNFKSLLFSDLNLSDDGLVSFDLNISVDPQISSYSL